jgi:hypothetical protein
LNLQPRKDSTVCEDIFDRLLVFGEATMPSSVILSGCDAAPTAEEEWLQSLGCSSNANPLLHSSVYARDNDEEGDDEDEDGEEGDDEVVERRALPSRSSRVRKSLAEPDEHEDDEYDDDRSSGSDDFPAARKAAKRKVRVSTLLYSCSI